MRRHGIRALAGRRFRPCTTDSRHDLPIAPNLLKQDFSAARPNTVWLAEPKDRAQLVRDVLRHLGQPRPALEPAAPALV